MNVLPIEEDDFVESHFTREFLLHAFYLWIQMRGRATANALSKANAASWFQYLVFDDYVNEGAPHETPKGKRYILKHRLEWLPNPVQLGPNHLIAPERAVMMAMQDYQLFCREANVPATPNRNRKEPSND